RAGATISYTGLAARAGIPGAARAAGAACAANLVAPVVPCHRALRSDGSLGGYYYGLERKEWLLRHQGAAGPRPGRGGWQARRDRRGRSAGPPPPWLRREGLWAVPGYGGTRREVVPAATPACRYGRRRLDSSAVGKGLSCARCSSPTGARSPSASCGRAGTPAWPAWQ